MAYKKIQFKRGTKTGMPVLRSGEPGFTQDEKSLYIGDGAANQRFLNETQTNTRIDEKIAPVTQSITNNVVTLNQTITNNVATLNQSIASNNATVNQAITDKAKINGEATNVNFIGNEIVKDGLIDKASSINTSNDFSIIFRYTSLNTSTASDILKVVGGFRINRSSNSSGTLSLYVSTITSETRYILSSNIPFGIPTYIVITKIKDKINISIGGYVETFYCGDMVNVNNVVNFGENSSYIIEFKNIYSRSLTNQEIQHNFNVINNSPSIVKINDYVIASDTDHITDSGSILQSKINRVFYRNMCKEFTSDGSHIVVNNGMDGYVLSGKIEGQTVKNYAETYVNENVDLSPQASMNGNILSVTATGATTRCRLIYKTKTLEANKRYKVVAFVYSNTLTGNFSLYSALDDEVFATQGIITQGQTGVVVFYATTKTDLSTAVYTFRSQIGSSVASGNIQFNAIIVDENSPTPTSYIPFGLNSTQATISNNGLKYSFYMPTIDGKTKVMKSLKGANSWAEIDASEVRDTAIYNYNLESINGGLGSVPNTYDYIDRARKVKIVNTQEIVVTEDMIYNLTTSRTNMDVLMVKKQADDIKYNSTSGVGNTFICDKYKMVETQIPDTIDGISLISTIYNPTNYGVSFPKGTTLEQAKASVIGIVIRYQLATPIEVPMTDAEIKVYDAYRKVIDLGGLEDSRNTWELKKDGSATWTKASNNIVLNGNETWVANIDMGTTMRFVTTISDKLNKSTFICDRFFVGEIGNINDIRQMIPVSDNRIIIQLLKTEASTVEQLKAWLQANPVIVRYQLATPIVTTIDKSLVPAILTQATNTFTFGDGVMATKATISAPIDRISEMQAEINEIKALIQTPSNINLTMNYVEDEYNKNQSIEGVV